MNRYESGMLAKSTAGHDAGKIYVIIGVDGAYVYLADGRVRTIHKAKKKNIRHIQIIRERHDVDQMNDAEIRQILKEYLKEIMED